MLRQSVTLRLFRREGLHRVVQSLLKIDKFIGDCVLFPICILTHSD
jgi:hypothetical protein